MLLEKDGGENPGFRSLLAQVMHQVDPKVIPTASDGEKGTELNLKKTGGAFRQGVYFNTTRIDLNQHYVYMWQVACSYQRYSPTNQFLYAGLKRKDLDFSRFGLIGYDKDCFFGLIGVMWRQPVPVF